MDRSEQRASDLGSARGRRRNGALPHYFLEFDVLDTGTGRFLSTRARRALMAAQPMVTPAPPTLEPLLGPATFQSANWRAAAMTLGVAHNEIEGLA